MLKGKGKLKNQSPQRVKQPISSGKSLMILDFYNDSTLMLIQFLATGSVWK
jgi:hypothetical protein